MEDLCLVTDQNRNNLYSISAYWMFKLAFFVLGRFFTQLFYNMVEIFAVKHDEERGQ